MEGNFPTKARAPHGKVHKVYTSLGGQVRTECAGHYANFQPVLGSGVLINDAWWKEVPNGTKVTCGNCHRIGFR